MDKVILVMNDPICCSNCPLLRSTRKSNTWICGIAHNNNNLDMVYEVVDIDSETRPDFCPLMSAPEHELLWHDDSRDDWARGYNACLDEILGGSDNG